MWNRADFCRISVPNKWHNNGTNGQVYAVYLYYYWQGKQVRLSVDLTVAFKDWNQDANGGAGEFRPSYGPNYKECNAYLKELMHDIDSKIMDYIKQHGEIDGDTIEAFVSGDDKALRADNGIDFIEFAKQRFIEGAMNSSSQAASLVI